MYVRAQCNDSAHGIAQFFFRLLFLLWYVFIIYMKCVMRQNESVESTHVSIPGGLEYNLPGSSMLKYDDDVALASFLAVLKC